MLEFDALEAGYHRKLDWNVEGSLTEFSHAKIEIPRKQKLTGVLQLRSDSSFSLSCGREGDDCRFGIVSQHCKRFIPN